MLAAANEILKQMDFKNVARFASSLSHSISTKCMSSLSIHSFQMCVFGLNSGICDARKTATRDSLDCVVAVSLVIAVLVVRWFLLVNAIN